MAYRKLVFLCTCTWLLRQRGWESRLTSHLFRGAAHWSPWMGRRLWEAMKIILFLFCSRRRSWKLSSFILKLSEVMKLSSFIWSRRRSWKFSSFILKLSEVMIIGLLYMKLSEVIPYFKLLEVIKNVLFEDVGGHESVLLYLKLSEVMKTVLLYLKLSKVMIIVLLYLKLSEVMKIVLLYFEVFGGRKYCPPLFWSCRRSWKLSSFILKLSEVMKIVHLYLKLSEVMKIVPFLKLSEVMKIVFLYFEAVGGHEN